MIPRLKRRKKTGGKKEAELLSSESCQDESRLSPTTSGQGDFTSGKKDHVRRALLQKRLSLDYGEADRKSQEIAGVVFGLPAFDRSRSLALYFPIKNEVQTQGIFQRAKAFGKDIYFPRIRGLELEFHRVSTLDELRVGTFGVPEPRPESDKINLKDVDLIIVPGIAFDLNGRRLGYGKGYYDRALSGVGAAKTVGLAYGFQVLGSLPIGVEDVGVGMVVTELGIIFEQGGD